MAAITSIRTMVNQLDGCLTRFQLINVCPYAAAAFLRYHVCASPSTKKPTTAISTTVTQLVVFHVRIVSDGSAIQAEITRGADALSTKVP